MLTLPFRVCLGRCLSALPSFSTALYDASRSVFNACLVVVILANIRLRSLPRLLSPSLFAPRHCR